MRARLWTAARAAAAAALLFSGVLFPLTAGSAAADGPGSIGLRLVDIPADAVDDPRAQLYIIDHVEPGLTIERRIEVSNSTDSTVEIELYSAAATIEAGVFLGADGHSPNDLSSWTVIDPGTLPVPSMSKLLAAVRIVVPGDAAPGEHFGVVWAEVRSAPADGNGVTAVSRVGIRIYLSVGPGGPPAADFTVDSLTASRTTTGRPVVVASVHNTGGRALDVHGSLELRNGPGGLSAGPFAVTVATTIAVGGTEGVTVVLDSQVPDGPWDAAVTLTSGLLDRSADARITFPKSGSAAPVATSSSVGWFVLGAGIVIVAVATIVLYRVRRPRARRARG